MIRAASQALIPYRRKFLILHGVSMLSKFSPKPRQNSVADYATSIHSAPRLSR